MVFSGNHYRGMSRRPVLPLKVSLHKKPYIGSSWENPKHFINTMAPLHRAPLNPVITLFDVLSFQAFGLPVCVKGAPELLFYASHNPDTPSSTASVVLAPLVLPVRLTSRWFVRLLPEPIAPSLP